MAAPFSEAPGTSWHTVTRGAFKCFTVGLGLGNKEVSENTQIVWMNMKFSFLGFFCWVLYYFVFVETLGSVTCYTCCGH